MPLKGVLMERRTLAVLAVAFAAAALTAPAACAERDRNILRNGSFEFANVYNGMKTIVDQGDELTAIWAIGLNRTWCDIGLEQWWGEGPTNAALFAKSSEAHSGKAALAVTAPGVATTWLAYAQENPKDGVEAVTLSWQAKGTADAAATAGNGSASRGRGNATKSVTGGKRYVDI